MQGRSACKCQPTVGVNEVLAKQAFSHDAYEPSAWLRCRRNQQSQSLRAQADAMRAAAKAYDPSRRDGGAGGGAAAARVRGQPSESHVEAKAREREQELIRRNYLGKPHEKRRITKASDKFKCGASPPLSQSTHAHPTSSHACLGLSGVPTHVQEHKCVSQSETIHCTKQRAGSTSTGTQRRTRPRRSCTRARCCLAAACARASTSARSARRSRRVSSRT